MKGLWVEVTLSRSCFREDQLPLLYRLHERPVARRWFDVLRRNLTSEGEDFAQQSARMGFLLHREQQQELLNVINAWIEETCPTTPNHNGRSLRELSPEGYQWLVQQRERCLASDREEEVKGRQVERLDELLLRYWQHLEALKMAGNGRRPFSQWLFYGDQRLRFELQPRDFKHFQVTAHFGALLAKYSEPGVSLLDAYFAEDGDARRALPTSHIQPQRTGQSGFELFFGQVWEPHYLEKFWPPFRWWLEERGYDVNDPRLALGKLELGRLQRTGRLQGLSDDEIYAVIARYDQVEGVRALTSRELWPQRGVDELKRRWQLVWSGERRFAQQNEKKQGQDRDQMRK